MLVRTGGFFGWGIGVFLGVSLAQGTFPGRGEAISFFEAAVAAVQRIRPLPFVLLSLNVIAILVGTMASGLGFGIGKSVLPFSSSISLT